MAGSTVWWIASVRSVPTRSAFSKGPSTARRRPKLALIGGLFEHNEAYGKLFGEVVRSQIARVANEVAQLKSTEAPPAAAIDLSNVQPSTIMDIIGVGDNDIWHTGNLYHVEWTPYLRGGTTNPSATYIRQRGMAAKIGPLVIAPFEILTDTVSGGSGHAYIHGTPFPVYSSQAGLPYSALVYNDDITGVTVKQMGIFWNGSYWILTWGTANERLQADNLLNGFHVFGTLIYHTSA